MSIITPEFKQLFNNRIDILLANDALTVPCTIKYVDTQWTGCPNCIVNNATGKSTNKYNNTGTIPFMHGVCPMCGGDGKIEDTPQDIVYLALIFDSKDWVKWNKQSISPHDAKMFVQSISNFESTYVKLKRAKYLDMDNNITPYTNGKYERFGEPEPVGLGDSNYIFVMWRRI